MDYPIEADDETALIAAADPILHVLANDRGLRNYWTRGAGAAKIRWGTDGSFDRCVRQLGKHVTRPQGLCAEYHKEATGEWPAEKGVESSMTTPLVAHGNHDQRSHGNRGKGVKSHFFFESFDPDETRDVLKGLDVKFEPTNVSQGGAPEYKLTGAPADVKKAAERLDIDEEDIEISEDFDVSDDKVSLSSSNIFTSQKSDTVARTYRSANSDFRIVNNGNGFNVFKTSSKSDLGKYWKYVGNAASLDKATGGATWNDITYDPEYGDQLRAKASGNSSLHPLIAAARKEKREEYADEPWSGVLAVEGIESGDSRLFNLGSLDWAPLPQPLMYQPANVGGHNASIVAGEITQISRRGEQIVGVGHVYGNMLAGEHGEGIRNMMKAGGVSVDVDKVKDADVEEVFADDDEGGFLSNPELTIFNRGRVRGATLVAFPAFVEAKLSFSNVVTASVDQDCGCNSGVLVAAGHTITIPDLPNPDWFKEPTDVKMYGAFTVTDEGRVFGYVAPSQTTHRSVKKRVPMGAKVDYSRWMNKETIVAGGHRIKTGVITMGCGHAETDPTRYGTLDNRKQHYDNTCSIFANVVVGETPGKGVWFAGAVRHGVTAEQITAAMGSSLSGDWQPHPDRPGVQEFIAALLVPVPGFPMARSRPSVELQDGVITASVVPVRFAQAEPRSVVDVASEALDWAKLSIMESLGIDPDSEKRRIMAEIEGLYV
jgi:hypothetical protein